MPQDGPKYSKMTSKINSGKFGSNNIILLNLLIYD